MKKVILLILIGISINMSLAQQPSSVHKISHGEMLKAYEDYFKDYDPLAPEPVRKAKFNKIVDKQNPNLSQADRERAFKIVDTYIRADQGLDAGINISDKDKQLIKNMLTDAEKQKEKAMQAMMGEAARYKKMSYAEFKNFITQNGQIPYKEAELKKAYNQIHKNDGKAITITAKDKQKSKQLNQMEAVDILREPGKHSFEEFKAAMKLLKPGISDEKIHKYWQKK